jgi:hypothetical protein
MTSGPQDHPRTALELLFGTGHDTPESLARQLLPADADGDFGRALEKLPGATREAAAREVTAAAAGLLSVDLTGALAAGGASIMTSSPLRNAPSPHPAASSWWT